MRHVPVLTFGLCLGLLLGFYAGANRTTRVQTPAPPAVKPVLTHAIIHQPDSANEAGKSDLTLFLTPAERVSDGPCPANMRHHWRVTTLGNEGTQQYYGIEVTQPQAN